MIDEPFECDASNTKVQCNIIFDTSFGSNDYTKVGSRGYVQVPCKCSLGGPKDKQGFCSSIIGHDIYQTAVAELANVLSSSNCHTRDRNNMRAQKDGCGIGT